jgi:hypothetical protein
VTDEVSGEAQGLDSGYPTKDESQVQAYCVKCRAKREMKYAKSITMKNGKPANQRPKASAQPEAQKYSERKELDLLLHSLTELRRAGFSRCRDIQPLYFTNHASQAFV